MAYVGGKQDRKLAIFYNLLEGIPVNTKDAAQYYGVSKKTIQRDIEAVRNFLSENNDEFGMLKEVVYDRKKDNYYIAGTDKLAAKEIFAISKVLLDSRAFCKSEFMPILDKFVDRYCYDGERIHVKGMIANEKYHYTEPRHGKKLIDTIWELSKAVKSHKCVRITYERLTEPKHWERTVQPVGIMFSDFYFYMAAFIPEKHTEFPTIYRIDRLSGFEVSDERFTVPYKNRFEEGEFKKRARFMYGGELMTVKFKYYGESVEAVLDKIPTAVIEKAEDGAYAIKAEVFGRGMKAWILSQTDKIEVLEPKELREEVLALVEKIRKRYG